MELTGLFGKMQIFVPQVLKFPCCGQFCLVWCRYSVGNCLLYFGMCWKSDLFRIAWIKSGVWATRAYDQLELGGEWSSLAAS